MKTTNILPSFFIALILMSCAKDVTIWYDEIKLESYVIKNYSNDAKQFNQHEIFKDSTHPNF